MSVYEMFRKWYALDFRQSCVHCGRRTPPERGHSQGVETFSLVLGKTHPDIGTVDANIAGGIDHQNGALPALSLVAACVKQGVVERTLTLPSRTEAGPEPAHKRLWAPSPLGGLHWLAVLTLMLNSIFR